MRYCLNPRCVDPRNPDDAIFCQNCGTKIPLADCYYAFQPLGQGQATRTFLAIDECKPSKPKCIIKQFSSQPQAGINFQEATELFRREATRLDELGDHEQIPRLLAHFEEKERLCLVQEYIEGQNLAQVAAAYGAFGETEIKDLLTQILPVLRYIHNRRIIHRDIKPANIIRRAQGTQLVLVDFGAAKLTVSPISGVAKKSGTVIGSARYAAPEQTMGKATYASDIYSLGLTCLNLLTLVDPFDLYSDLEYKWVWRDYLPNNNLISDNLGKILDRMVATELNQRYQSVAEILKDIDRPDETNNQETDYLFLFNEVISRNLHPKSSSAASASEHKQSQSGGSNNQSTVQIPHIPDVSSASTWSGQKKSRAIAIMLCFIGGWAGLQKFYLGQTGWGAGYCILTVLSGGFIPSILSIAEGIYLINISDADFARIYGVELIEPSNRRPRYPISGSNGRSGTKTARHNLGSEPQNLSKRDILAALADLKDLYDRGIITAEEYEEKRQKFLRSL
ncbi:serine/threonine protein kinase [Thalassoporum mexicanum PCC 7367]|uniref:protein kinase domain-containing protein n=1 Tax=Thalassoporum mexicanum TaxID=3457544 RepID=UPI00029FC685|nr:protein kinase [Pseudanabaena sp. PCC 7367]AFY68486.1 serine/threonine protein kinase [Pseudanabaena sp. PCC 7367]